MKKPMKVLPLSAETRLQELSLLAKTIFDADASKWMLSPHLMLDSKSPIDVGATESGYQRVKDILISVKHGGVV